MLAYNADQTTLKGRLHGAFVAATVGATVVIRQSNVSCAP